MYVNLESAQMKRPVLMIGCAASLALLMCLTAQPKAVNSGSATLESTELPTPSNMAGWNTYKDSVHGLTIQYPPAMTVETAQDVIDHSGFDYFPLCSYDDPDKFQTNFVVCFYLPVTIDTSPGVTGASIAIRVLAQGDPNCPTPEPTDDPTMQRKQVIINGVPFEAVSSEDAGMMHFISTTVYSTLLHKQCIILIQSITGSEYTDRDNATMAPGDDLVSIGAILDQTIATLRFTAP
jgi:hypothetical protein